jgi:hypothetical protein
MVFRDTMTLYNSDSSIARPSRMPSSRHVWPTRGRPARPGARRRARPEYAQRPELTRRQQQVCDDNTTNDSADALVWSRPVRRMDGLVRSARRQPVPPMASGSSTASVRTPQQPTIYP